MTTSNHSAHRRGWRVAVSLAAAAVLIGTAACTDTSQAKNPASEGRGDGEVPAEVTERLDAALAIPELESPGAPVDVSHAAGKSVFVIPLFSNNEYNQLIDAAMVEAGKLTDTQVTIFDNQGQVNQWVAGVNQAISSRADVLVLSGGIDPRLLLPQIEDAQAAGILVVSSQFYDNEFETGDCGDAITLECPGSLDAVVPAPYSLSAQIAADWIIADSGGTANTLVLTASDVGPNAHQEAAARATLEKYCPDCTQTFVDIPSAQWATNTQSTVQSELNRDSSIDYILPVYDVMAADAATAVGVAGRTGSVKISTFNGTPAVLELIQSGDVVAANIAQNLAQIGYANMDQVYRLFAGEKPSTSSRDVIRLFDASNVDDAGTPPEANAGFGDGYRDDYLSLWGLD